MFGRVWKSRLERENRMGARHEGASPRARRTPRNGLSDSYPIIIIAARLFKSARVIERERVFILDGDFERDMLLASDKDFLNGAGEDLASVAASLVLWQHPKAIDMPAMRAIRHIDLAYDYAIQLAYIIDTVRLLKRFLGVPGYVVFWDIKNERGNVRDYRELVRRGRPELQTLLKARGHFRLFQHHLIFGVIVACAQRARKGLARRRFLPYYTQDFRQATPLALCPGLLADPRHDT